MGREILRRSCEPWQSSTFCLGFLLNVLFGGWAIWLELLLYANDQPKHDAESIHAALVTFFPAVTGVTFVQVVLEHRGETRLTISALLLLCIIIASSTVLTLGAMRVDTLRFAMLAGLFGFTMWFWVIANADARIFFENVDSAVGGNPNAKLSGDPSAGVH
ncbi:hypothetical protein ASF53_11860 [Methylobacterium sp. Leaf123]|nr:hypothetical protein ASF53_11860 [Methylobacterium sp. Leaf123]